jgi:2,3-bisphosphoglycerate-independent phosphoglycerate mutase
VRFTRIRAPRWPNLSPSDYGKLATIVGRYYAMDRDKRWERIKIAVEGLTVPQGTPETVKVTDAKDAVTQVEESYKRDVTDEFLKPIIVGGDETRIQGNQYHTFLYSPVDTS